jgi:hypothetical protein
MRQALNGDGGGGCVEGYGSPNDDLDAFIAGVDAALTRQYGPDHQKALTASAGAVVRSFEWRDPPPPRSPP